MSSGWVGVDPGGASSGVVARYGDLCVMSTVVVRGDLPMGVYVREVVDAAEAALEELDAFAENHGEDPVAVEDLNPPNPHMGLTSVRGLIDTAKVLGGVLAWWPSAVVVPPGGHGSGPLGAYPDTLHPTRGRGRGRDRMRHCRSAWDVSIAGEHLARQEAMIR